MGPARVSPPLPLLIVALLLILTLPARGGELPEPFSPCPYPSASAQAGDGPFVVLSIGGENLALPLRALLEVGFASLGEHAPRPAYLLHLPASGRLLAFLRPDWAKGEPLLAGAETRPLLSFGELEVDPLTLELVQPEGDLTSPRWPALATLPLSLVERDELAAWRRPRLLCAEPLTLTHPYSGQDDLAAHTRVVALLGGDELSLPLADARARGVVEARLPGGGYLYLLRWPSSGRLALFRSPRSLSLRLTPEGFTDRDGVRYGPDGVGVDGLGRLHSLTPIPFALALPPPD